MIGSSGGTGPSQYPYYIFDSNAELGGVPSTLAFAGTGNENVYPSYAFPYKQRLVLANFGKGYENTIVFTDNYTADVVGNSVLASNGRAISLVAGADGDEIVGGIEVMLTNVGSPAESGLLILRRYGNPFLLTGDMDQTTGGTSTLTIQRISVNCGCAGQYTVARTPVGIIWAGVDDVWCFAAGVLPHRIGQKIQPALKVTPTSLQYRWSAAYFDGFYRLAVWGAGQGMTDTDAPGDQWWLDLREGLPQDWREARWWGPQQFLGGASAGVAPTPRTWAMVAENRAGMDARLFYLDRVEMAAGLFGPAVGEYGTNTRDTTANAAYITDAAYVDPEITAELITKEYALAPARDQINDGILFSLRPSNDLTVSADFVIDDGDQVISRTKRLGAADPFRLDSSTLDTTGNTVTGRAIKTAIYPATRRAGQTHRFRIYDTAGYTIITGVNDLFIFGANAYNVTPSQYIATVPQGTYTLSTLFTALAAALAYDSAGTSHGSVQSALNAFGCQVSLASGVLSFDDLLDPGQSNFVINFDANTNVVNAYATAAQLTACRRLLGGIYGFETTLTVVQTGDGTAAPAVSASGTAQFKKGISDWEIYGIAANMEVLPRTP
jgi:hypothetical protein